LADRLLILGGTLLFPLLYVCWLVFASPPRFVVLALLYCGWAAMGLGASVYVGMFLHQIYRIIRLLMDDLEAGAKRQAEGEANE
jgi:hypothetical protein